ncbi:MAG: AAA family ATPase [Planctomycetaceae bacterium]|jgi:type II secretory pathway predicted ATPase ExeA|nr:AAA family ATPase [Planctomycetaceae bacterium]
MYETFFGLKRRPFLSVPDTESYFPIPQMEEARLLIERTVRRGEGIALVFGQSGVGKSLLLRILRKSLEQDFDVASLAGGRINNAKAFLQNLLHELHLPYTGADETELRLILDDYVKTQTSQGLLLLIDESQFLDRIPLDEIRLLLNSDDGSTPLFRVVLAGTNEFEEKLTSPQFDSFNQRVTTRIYIDTLSRTETFQYIAWQTNISKYNEKNTTKQKKNYYSNTNENYQFNDQLHDQFIDNNSDKIDVLRIDFPHGKNSELIFTDSAKDEIFRLTDGLPRQINQLCDTALQLAAQQAAGSIDEIVILAAWGKLQQINVDEMLSNRANKVEQVKTESYDEIIARKKNTLRLKEVSSHIEYGSLDDDTKTFDTNEEHKPQPTYRVYKPPYPEDDPANEFKKFDADTEIYAYEIEKNNNIVAQNETNIEKDNEQKIDDNNIIDNIIGDSTIEEVDDELVERLISFELSTATIESAEQVNADNIDADNNANDAADNNDLLPVLRNRSNQFSHPVQRQLFVTKIPQFVQTKGERRFMVHFLMPVNSATDAENCADNLRAVCSVYYCYKKPVVCRVGNNRSNGKLSGKRVGIKLNFTIWRSCIIHSWIGNWSAGCIGITAGIFDVENCTDKNADADVNTKILTISKTDIDTNTDTDTEIGIDIDSEDSDMNRASLKKYGEEVLSGRPEFVRKEPVYVYQRGEMSGFDREYESGKVNEIHGKNIDVESCRRIIVTKNHLLHIAKESVESYDKNLKQQNTETQFDNDVANNIDSDVASEIDSEIDSDINSNNIVPDWASEFIDVECDDDSDNYADKENADEVNVAGDVVVSEVEVLDDLSDGVGYGRIVLNWVNESFDLDHGFGVAYREFSANSGNVETGQVLSAELSGGAVVKASDGGHGSERTSFDERFDETIRVRRSTITLDEVYRSVRKLQVDPQVSLDSLLNIERQIADVVKRITLAVDKIEFVAEQAEDAGKKVSDAAELTRLAGQKIDQTAASVEAEVKTAIPNYKDLFRQLSDFQKTITNEVQNLKYRSENLDGNDNDQEDNNDSLSENNFLLNQSRPHELKAYRNSGKRLSRPVSSDNIKLPTAEIRGSNIKTIDVKSLFQDNEL